MHTMDALLSHKATGKDDDMANVECPDHIDTTHIPTI